MILLHGRDRNNEIYLRGDSIIRVTDAGWHGGSYVVTVDKQSLHVSEPADEVRRKAEGDR